jgi:hypothetical protein
MPGSLVESTGYVWNWSFAERRLPTRAFGRNHWRQIAHGLFRASGMVMLHGHHAAARTVGGQIRMPGSWYYVEFRIMVSSGDELEQDGGFSMDRPT